MRALCVTLAMLMGFQLGVSQLNESTTGSSSYTLVVVAPENERAAAEYLVSVSDQGAEMAGVLKVAEQYGFTVAQRKPDELVLISQSLVLTPAIRRANTLRTLLAQLDGGEFQNIAKEWLLSEQRALEQWLPTSSDLLEQFGMPFSKWLSEGELTKASLGAFVEVTLVAPDLSQSPTFKIYTINPSRSQLREVFSRLPKTNLPNLDTINTKNFVRLEEKKRGICILFNRVVHPEGHPQRAEEALALLNAIRRSGEEYFRQVIEAFTGLGRAYGISPGEYSYDQLPPFLRDAVRSAYSEAKANQSGAEGSVSTTLNLDKLRAQIRVVPMIRYSLRYQDETIELGAEVSDLPTVPILILSRSKAEQ